MENTILDITTDVDNNMFAPELAITRQEMFTLMYNALKVFDKLPEGASGKTLSNFTDAGSIAPWVQAAMTALIKAGTITGDGGKLNRRTPPPARKWHRCCITCWGNNRSK